MLIKHHQGGLPHRRRRRCSSAASLAATAVVLLLALFVDLAHAFGMCLRASRWCPPPHNMHSFRWADGVGSHACTNESRSSPCHPRWSAAAPATSSSSSSMASTGGGKSGKGDYSGGAIDPTKLGLNVGKAEQGPDDLFSKPAKSWPELVGAFPEWTMGFWEGLDRIRVHARGLLHLHWLEMDGRMRLLRQPSLRT